LETALKIVSQKEHKLLSMEIIQAEITSTEILLRVVTRFSLPLTLFKCMEE